MSTSTDRKTQSDDSDDADDPETPDSEPRASPRTSPEKRGNGSCINPRCLDVNAGSAIRPKKCRILESKREQGGIGGGLSASSPLLV